MAEVANTTSGDIDGTVVQAREVGGDVNITNYAAPKRSLLRLTAVAGAVVVASLVVVANLGSGTKPVHLGTSSSPPPLASTPSPPPVTPVATPVTTPPVPAVVVQPPRPPARTSPPPPPPQPTTVPSQPTYPRPPDDGPGYLLPSNSDEKAIDFYDNQHHDAVVWDRHPPGTEPSYQPHWVREFTGTGAFRIRNEQVNRCLEPVRDPERGDHVVANVCAWGAEAQWWRSQNNTQYASVKFGACLGVANNGSYANGTWLLITLCSGTPDQNWRVVR
jgi:hypothetical protein